MSTPAPSPNFIDGQWVTGDPAGWLDVVNPATGEPVARVATAAGAEVDAAVAAARRAWQTWRWVNPARRAHLLHALADEVAAAEATIGEAITREMGKPLSEARGEVRKLATAFHFYAEEATRILGRTIPNTEDGFVSIVEHEPIGVVAAISPWNYPVELIGWKLGGALAAGCTIVVKPSEYTPSCAVEVFRCLERAGAPAGVANLVPGDGGTGRLLVAHPDIDKVAFTGSVQTGQAIYRTVQGIKPISLELGGSCPMIVTEHADLDAAVRGAVRRSFRNAGQICIAINRIYVQQRVYEPFVQQLAAATEKLVVGDGLANPDADVGPLTNLEVLERTERHVQDARDRGGRVLCGGRRPEQHPRGNFYEPTVVADGTPDMLLMHEETFGPAVGVAPFTTLEEAVDLANGTPAGLAAYAYTRDTTEVFTLGRRLDFGNVAVNNVDAGIINAPYGGRKQSGVGLEHGREGMEEYLQTKHLRVRYGN